MIKLVSIFLSLLFCFTACFTATADRGKTFREMAKIEIHKESSVNSMDSLYLRDIASFSNVSKDLQKSLESLQVKVNSEVKDKQSPNEVLYESFELSSLFRSSIAKLQREHKTRIIFKVPNKVIVRVRQPSNENEREFKEEVVQRQIIRHLEKNCNDCKVTVSEIRMPAVDLKKMNNSNWKLQFPQKKIRGAFSLPIIVSENEKKRTYWVSGNAKIFMKVPVALKKFRIGERVKFGDYKMEYRDISFAIDGNPTEAKLVGAKLKRGLAVDQVIWHEDLRKEKAIRYGDIAQVFIGNGDWQISTTAVAKEDGEVGDVIKLSNPKSRKKYRAKIIGDKKVRIEL